MNTSSTSYVAVRHNRVSKKRNVIGLYDSGRSVSLNQLNINYLDQWYKEKYFLLKEQHEQTKQQFNKQQEQLKQLNCRLQRLLEEKKDFLSQFVHYSQVNADYLIQELEMTNSSLKKENKKLKDELLLAHIRAVSNNSNTNNLNKAMVINTKQHLQTNYSWVKSRIDSGLNDRTKRNQISGQLVRERKANGSIYQNKNKKYATNKRLFGKLIEHKSKINKDRHHVTFANQLEQEHLYEDDFEKDEEEILENSSSENSLKEGQMSKSGDLGRENNKDAEELNTIDKLESSDEDEKQFKNQLKKAENKIKRLEEIVLLQQQFIDKQQDLINQQMDNSNSSQNDEKWINKENIYSNFDTNSCLNNLSLSSSSSLSTNEELTSIKIADTGESQQNLTQAYNIDTPKMIKEMEIDELMVTNYEENNETDKSKKKIPTNNVNKLLKSNLKKNIFESTKSILNDDDATTSSLSSLDQMALSTFKETSENCTRILSSNDDKKIMKNDLITYKTNNKQDSRTENLLKNLRKQFEVEKIRNDQLEKKNRVRLRDLEQNINELTKENQILRNSLEKCIQDCLNEIGVSGLG